MTDHNQPPAAIDREIVGLFTDHDGSYEAHGAALAAVRAKGPEATPTLIRIVSGTIDPSLAPAERVAELVGKAAILLGELAVPDAVEPLLAALARLDPDDNRFDLVRDALGQIGPPALDALLAAYQASPPGGRRAALAWALGHLGVKQESLFQLLVEFLAADAFWGAYALRAYGDDRAVPYLRKALNDYDPEALYPDADPADLDAEVTGDLEALESALAVLGAPLTEDELEQLNEKLGF